MVARNGLWVPVENTDAFDFVENVLRPRYEFDQDMYLSAKQYF